jgi:acyl carrier protein
MQLHQAREMKPSAGGTAVDRRTIEDWLVARIAHSQSIDPEQIDVGESFVANGLSSASSVALIGELGRVRGVPLSETLCWEYPSIAALAEHVAGLGASTHNG